MLHNTFAGVLQNKKNHELNTMAQTVELAEAWDEDCKIFCSQRPWVQTPREEVAMKGESHGKHPVRYLGPLLQSKLIPSDRKSLNSFTRNIRKELTLLLEDRRNCDLCF